jgi:outer membrane protein OmpA-like peptidoglycan-associated protein
MKGETCMKQTRCMLIGAVVAQLVAGCATPPPPPAPPPPKLASYAVLLDNLDGSVGAITFTGSKGTIAVDRGKNAVNLDGATAPYTLDDSTIQKDFGAAIAARPQPPAIFLLYFESGGTQLTSESQALIAKIVADAAKRPAADVSVIGHTDTEGDADANEKLGLERAQTVAQLISGAGLKAIETTVTSHGERDLLVKTPDNTAEPKNRRVEVTIR